MAEKCSVHFLLRNGSTARPTNPATSAPRALPTVNSPRANSLSSGVTYRETAWGECKTIIPATRPRVEQRAIMIQMYQTKWYQDSNRKKIRCAISSTETIKIKNNISLKKVTSIELKIKVKTILKTRSSEM